MHWHHLIEIICERGFERVIVTGCQRSGTTVAAHILAEELDYKYVDELMIGGAYKLEQLIEQLDKDYEMVIQCPVMSSSVHKIPEKIEKYCVVFMLRDPKEVIASMHEWNWHAKGAYQEERDRYLKDNDLSFFANPFTEPVEMASACWFLYQRWLLGSKAFELEYDSLSNHELWIPKEQRTDGWGFKSWKKEED